MIHGDQRYLANLASGGASSACMCRMACIKNSAAMDDRSKTNRRIHDVLLTVKKLARMDA